MYIFVLIFWCPIRFGPRQHDSEVRIGFLSLGGGKEKKI